jgi:hypothetical protein
MDLGNKQGVVVASNEVMICLKFGWKSMNESWDFWIGKDELLLLLFVHEQYSRTVHVLYGGLSVDTEFAQQELSWVVYALQLTYDDYVNASNSSSIMQSMHTMF